MQNQQLHVFFEIPKQCNAATKKIKEMMCLTSSVDIVKSNLLDQGIKNGVCYRQPLAVLVSVN